MKPVDLIILIICLSIVIGVVGNYIYRKYKKMPTGDCGYCSMKSEKTLKLIRKELAKDKINRK
jgi:hypothetical protein